MAIDVRNPQGEFGGSFQAASDILASIQKANKAKADRNTLNEISKARALNPNASIDEILAGLPQAQEASGLAGIIQRITGAGQGDIREQLQARSLTQPRSTLNPEERAKAERVKAGLIPRAGAGKTPIQELSALTLIAERAAGPDFGLDANTGKVDEQGEAIFRTIPAANPEVLKFVQDEMTKVLAGLEDQKKNVPKGVAKKVDQILKQAKQQPALSDVAQQAEGFLDTDLSGTPAPSGTRTFVPGNERLSFRGGKVVQIGTLKLDKPLDLLDARTMRAIGIDNTQTIAQAIEDGLFSEEEIKSINDGLEKDPSRVTDILALIESLRSGK